MTDNAITIEWFAKEPALSQVYSTGMEYCFLTADDKQACAFVLCKDFFQDALMALHNGKKAAVYGFSYDPQKDLPICLGRCRIAIGNQQDRDFMKKIPAVIDFLNQFEKKLHLMRTTSRSVANPPEKYKKQGVIVFEGSNRWILSPPMISLYTLLIRVGFCHKLGEPYQSTIDGLIGGKIKPYQNNDASFLRDGKPGMELILKHGYARIFYKDPKKNFPDVSTGTMHNRFGIVAFSNGDTKDRIKHWHRKLTKSKKKKVKETEE